MNGETAFHSLLEVPPGLSVCVREIDGPSVMRARLCALGLTPGVIVAIFPTSGKDTRRICVRGSALVLSRDMAECVKCSVVRDDCRACHAGAQGFAHLCDTPA